MNSFFLHAWIGPAQMHVLFVLVYSRITYLKMKKCKNFYHTKIIPHTGLFVSTLRGIYHCKDLSYACFAKEFKCTIQIKPFKPIS